jgi:predicted component of type VI protein secretion system
MAKAGPYDMELKLIVLAGAKVGTEIPLKKDEFFIGRAKECTLRAGSEAISRKHCVIARNGDGWTVQDLKSRNGTHVNDVRTEGVTPLAPGDELRVGPLRFRVEERIPRPAAIKTADISRGKQAAVKDVADVAQRTAAKSDSNMSEDDISRWLLGGGNAAAGDSLKETRPIRMEETTTIDLPKVSPATAESGNAGDAQADAPSDSKIERVDSAEQKAGGWSWLKRGKPGESKKKPGKLPPRPAEPSSKDSREAAADILREMTRRR